MVTTYTLDGRCPCCGRSTAASWADKPLAEMDRGDLLDVIQALQVNFDQVSEQFLQIAKLNQRILSREAMLSGRGKA